MKKHLNSFISFFRQRPSGPWRVWPRPTRKSVPLTGVALLFCFLVFFFYFLPPNWLSLLIQSLTHAGQLISSIIEYLGYPGVLLLMIMESMIFPVPSELVMPFAGFLAVQGNLNVWLVILFSSIGSIIGSLFSYYIGYYGGHRFVNKFGKYFLLDATDLQKTEHWFARRGERTIFISRFIPIVRHLISLPAGMGKMKLSKFIVYTLIGATLWNSFLTYLGWILGKNWATVRHYTEYFTITVAVLLLIAGTWFVYHHIKNKRQTIVNK